MVYGGDGLARLPAEERGQGKAVFIPFVLEGERVETKLFEQKKGFARGSANAILETSAQRVGPGCPYFTRCGGCHYQHTNYEHQLDIKAAILRENLRRIAKLDLDCELQVHPSPPWNYRNRTRLSVQNSPAFNLCYHQWNSHQLIAVEKCPISSPLINRAIAAILALGRTEPVPNGILEIELFADAEDASLLIEVSCEPKTRFPEAWAENLMRQMPEITGVTASCVYEGNVPRISKPSFSKGESQLTYETSHSSYRVSAGAFFQVNRHLIDRLVKIVTSGRSGQTALDLYAGVGLFSSVLNREFQRVIAVESSQISYEDLVYNSPANVKAVNTTTELYLKNAAGKLHPDFVVIDPPRGGLNDAVIAGLKSLNAPRFTYVSCDPATLSRDLRGLLSAGYKVEEAHLVDLFPQTFHIESGFHMVR